MAYLENYTEVDLIRLASFYGLPLEYRNYAPLILLLKNHQVNLYNDASDNVNFVLSASKEVQFYKDENGNPTKPAFIQTYQQTETVIKTLEDGTQQEEVQPVGDPVEYNPLDPNVTVPEGAIIGFVPWFARADYANNQLTFGNKVFLEDLQNSRRGTYTSESLEGHEISHLIVGTSGPGVIASQYAGSVIGFGVNPRSSNKSEEIVTDLIINGLFGTFENNVEGKKRKQEFSTIVEDIFKNNYPNIPDYFMIDY